MACYCCVLGCKNNNHKSTGKHFFRFPKNDEKRRKLWKKFARKTIKATAVICQDHFDSMFMIQRDKKLKLTNDAVPTVLCRKSTDGLETEVKIGFDGEDYYGDEANELTKAMAKTEDQEIIAIEAAFIDEQVKLDELRTRCRFCAEMRDELIDISSFATYNIKIGDFLSCLGLKVSDNDFFPNSVCEECFNQVLVIDTFAIKCKTADQWLWNEIAKLRTFTTVVSPNQPAAIVRAEQPTEVEIFNECEANFTENENLTESYTEIIQEDEIVEGDQIFTVAYEKSEDCGLKSPTNGVIDSKNSRNESVIMDPSCNKFAMKTYNCEICFRVFAGLKTYKSHVCDVAEIRCSDCGDNFETAFALQSHRRHLHQEKQQKNYCPICKTVITGRSTVFKKHKTKCNRDRVEKIQCDNCSKTFASLHGFTVHQMFHESRKKAEEDVFAAECLKPERKKAEVICELCGKTYTTIGDCRRHIKLKHTEITEVFSCDICNKNYPSKSVLKDHFRNTHVVNEVACTFCGKVFRNKTHLKKHMVYHDESKKVHKCLICPDQPGFINKVGLLRHQSRHANNNDDKVYYNCEICINYNFHTSLQLKSHLKHVHGIDQ